MKWGPLEQIQQGEGEQLAPPTLSVDGSLAKKIKFIAWKEVGRGGHVKSIKAMEVNN